MSVIENCDIRCWCNLILFQVKSAEFHNDPVLKACGVTINQSMETLSGRVLPPPTIEYKEHNVFNYCIAHYIITRMFVTSNLGMWEELASRKILLNPPPPQSSRMGTHRSYALLGV